MAPLSAGKRDKRVGKLVEQNVGERLRWAEREAAARADARLRQGLETSRAQLDELAQAALSDVAANLESLVAESTSVAKRRFEDATEARLRRLAPDAHSHSLVDDAEQRLGQMLELLVRQAETQVLEAIDRAVAAGEQRLERQAARLAHEAEVLHREIEERVRAGGLKRLRLEFDRLRAEADRAAQEATKRIESPRVRQGAPLGTGATRRPR